jgi:hypothetical protein
MYNAGFKDVQVFWRNFMFIGAIAIKWVRQVKRKECMKV